MALQDDLLAIDNALWTGGPVAYRHNLDEHCLIAFTEMVGVKTREEVAATVEGGSRWKDVEIEFEGLMRPSADVAVLTYRASARRGEDEHYRALVSSGYVRREGEWKMMFHQQTPL